MEFEVFRPGISLTPGEALKSACDGLRLHRYLTVAAGFRILCRNFGVKG